MQTTFDHTFRADLMKSNIFRNEQDANEFSKMLQRSIFLDRTTSKALPTTSTIKIDWWTQQRFFLSQQFCFVNYRSCNDRTSVWKCFARCPVQKIRSLRLFRAFVCILLISENIRFHQISSKCVVECCLHLFELCALMLSSTRYNLVSTSLWFLSFRL